MLAIALLLSAAGCGTAVSSGESTALDFFDLNAMATQMSQSIAGDTQVREAIEERGSLRIVVQPVENRLRGEVLPLGQARAFTAKVRHLLAEADTGDYTWINNRDTFYALRGRELEGVDLGPAPEAIDPEYGLTATFSSMADDNKHERQAFYVCTFQLTNLQDRTVLWEDVYNVEKRAVKNFLD